MTLFKKNLHLFFTIIPLISFFIGIWAGQFVYDGYHWGFIYANALDLLQGKIPFKEIFIQYGLLTTIIHSLVLYIFGNNVFYLVVFTNLIYSISLFLISIITYKLTKNYKYSFYSCLIIFCICPWATSPWPHFISFFFVCLSLFFYILI